MAPPDSSPWPLSHEMLNNPSITPARRRQSAPVVGLTCQKHLVQMEPVPHGIRRNFHKHPISLNVQVTVEIVLLGRCQVDPNGHGIGIPSVDRIGIHLCLHLARALSGELKDRVAFGMHTEDWHGDCLSCVYETVAAVE